MRHRKTDAHIATIRVSVPIDPMDMFTITTASMAIRDIGTYLPQGSTVEVLNSRFGRVDAPTPPKLADLLTHDPAFNAALDRSLNEFPSSVVDAMAELKQRVEGGISAGDGMDPPESLRRVPRPAPNGGG